MIHLHCPSCAGARLEPFFLLRNAPIFSLVTIPSEEQASQVARKDLELAICHSCGFIFNRLFNVDIDYFSSGYEDQQGYSITFVKYMRALADSMIQKHNLKGKLLMEIGCGKGDFISMLTDLSGGRGIGIDPAYAERGTSHSAVSFIRDYFAVIHGSYEPDFVCCRHTLEHIHATRSFLTQIRSALGNHSATVVMFEIPQVSRILDSMAFWDIYYEHCSYFSAGSLARLFRGTGFEILDLYYTYDNQYLVVEAVPSMSQSTRTFPIEESISDQLHRVERFSAQITQQLAEWRSKLQSLMAAHRKTVIWGGGSKAVGFLTNFSDLDAISCVVDINPHMEGNYVPGIGKRYVQPAFLRENAPDAVIVMNAIYLDEIRRTLNGFGLNPDIYAL